MSDREQLAARLVELGAAKIADRNRRAWIHSDATQYRLEAGSVTVAVLRVLAAQGALAEDLGGDWQEMCRGLADYIEKGQEGSDG